MILLEATNSYQLQRLLAQPPIQFTPATAPSPPPQTPHPSTSAAPSCSADVPGSSSPGHSPTPTRPAPEQPCDNAWEHRPRAGSCGRSGQRSLAHCFVMMRECSQYSGLRINSACIYLGDGNFTDAVRTFPRATTMAEVGRKLLTGRAEITPPSFSRFSSTL